MQTKLVLSIFLPNVVDIPPERERRMPTFRHASYRQEYRQKNVVFLSAFLPTAYNFPTENIVRQCFMYRKTANYGNEITEKLQTMAIIPLIFRIAKFSSVGRNADKTCFVDIPAEILSIFLPNEHRIGRNIAKKTLFFCLHRLPMS